MGGQPPNVIGDELLFFAGKLGKARKPTVAAMLGGANNHMNSEIANFEWGPFCTPPSTQGSLRHEGFRRRWPFSLIFYLPA